MKTDCQICHYSLEFMDDDASAELDGFEGPICAQCAEDIQFDREQGEGDEDD